MVKTKGGVPRGYQAVMPYLRVRDAALAIKFYKKVLGAKENFRLKMAGKIGHAELDVGGAVIMISDEFPDAKAVGPKTLKGTSVHLAAYVQDADKVFAKALRAGAKARQQVQDQFYGDRMGQFEDPFGHVWSIHTRIQAVTPKEMQKRLDAMLRGEGAPTLARRGRGGAGRKAAEGKTVKVPTAKSAPVKAARVRSAAAKAPGRKAASRRKASA
jgi:PhnB protein